MVTMPLITPSMLAQQINTVAVVPPIQPAPAETAASFSASLEQQAIAGETRAAAPQQAAPALGDLPSTGTGGDAILSGLQRLRSTFDTQESRIAGLMDGPVTRIDTMLALQMEMTNYSILIDMTSKLASKAAQGLDTLMKG